jgi:DNA polymerase-3 subunit delta'
MLFNDICGFEQTKKQLLESVKKNRVSHAQLFFGPTGNAKISLALAYAQYLNCLKRTDEDSCGNCNSCIKYNNLTHPDLHFIFPVLKTPEYNKPISDNFIQQWREMVLSNPYFNINNWISNLDVNKKKLKPQIYVHESEDVQKKMMLKNYEANKKIFFVWLPENMNIPAANKLLKTIEEPNPKTVFIMISENINKIIPTIKSRLQMIRTRRFSIEEASCQVEKTNQPVQNINELYQLTNGDLGQILFLSRNENEVNQNFEEFVFIMRACYQVNIEKISTFTENMSSKNNMQQELFLSYALKIIRDCMLYKYSSELLLISTKEKDFIANFHQFVNGGNIVQITEEIEEAIRLINRNANPKILFFDLCLKLTRLINSKSKMVN